MWSMFNGLYSLKSLDLSKFNTSNVTDIKRMFMNCINIKKLDLSSFDLQKVSDATQMLSQMTSLKELKTPYQYSNDLSIIIDLPKTLYDFNKNAYTNLDNTSSTGTWLTDNN